jgi:hypothetical protein
MEKKGFEKEIDYLLLAKNNLWTIFLATTGGTLGLLFTPLNSLKIFLLIIGFILIICFLDAYFRKDAKIEDRIKKLKEGTKYVE